MSFATQATFRGVAIQGTVEPYQEGEIETFIDRTHTPGLIGTDDIALGTGAQRIVLDIRLGGFANDAALDAYLGGTIAPLLTKNGTLSIAGGRVATYAECTLESVRSVGDRTLQPHDSNQRRTQLFRFVFVSNRPM